MSIQTPSGKTVAVASGSLTIRKMLSAALASYKARILELTSARELLERISKEKCDVLFLDNSLGDSTADELLLKLEESDGRQFGKIILISSDLQKAEKLLGVFTQVTGILQKPFDQKQVAARAEEAFGLRAMTSPPFVMSRFAEAKTTPDTVIRTILKEELEKVAAVMPSLEHSRKPNENPSDFYLRFLASNRLALRLRQALEVIAQQQKTPLEELEMSGLVRPETLHGLISWVEESCLTGRVEFRCSGETLTVLLFSGAVTAVSTTSSKQVWAFLRENPRHLAYAKAGDLLMPGDSPLVFTEKANKREVFYELSLHLLKIIHTESTSFRVFKGYRECEWAKAHAIGDSFASLMLEGLRGHFRTSVGRPLNASGCFARTFRSPSRWIEPHLNFEESRILNLAFSELTAIEMAEITGIPPPQAASVLLLLESLGLVWEKEESGNEEVMRLPSPTPLRILILTHTLEWIERLNKAFDPDHTVVAVCDSFEQAVAAVSRMEIQIVFSDGEVSDSPGFESVAKLVKIRPEIRWIALEGASLRESLNEASLLMPQLFITRERDLGTLGQTLARLHSTLQGSKTRWIADVENPALGQLKTLKLKQAYIRDKEIQLQQREADLVINESRFMESCNRLEEERVLLEMKKEEFELSEHPNPPSTPSSSRYGT